MRPVWTNAFFRRLERIGVGWHCIYGERQGRAVLGKERKAGEASSKRKSYLGVIFCRVNECRFDEELSNILQGQQGNPN